MTSTLESIARPEAERLARELYNTRTPAHRRREIAMDAKLFVWADLGLYERPGYVEPQVMLLCDLTRPASMDFWARWLAERVGLTVGATAPVWHYCGPSVSTRDSDGAPDGEDWPTCWMLFGEDASAYFCEPQDDAWLPNDEWRAVPGIIALTDPRGALRAAVLSVGGVS